ncbi:MAG: RNA ligase [Planctomycetota bacterium]|nr:MAG: RNA ligase [Planctomycetota bacterium]
MEDQPPAVLPGLERPWEVVAAATGHPFDEGHWRRALAERRVRLEQDWAAPFFRFSRDCAPAARGSVILREGYLWDFPHIARVLHLERGLRRAFAGPFEVEEKVDGYNVRIVRTGGELLAFSRSGYVCPFATDRLRELPGLARLLAERPELVACAEVAGPGNPYNVESPPWIERDVRLVVFDLGTLGPRRFLPPAERNALLERYGIEGVRRFGVFEPTDAAGVFEVVRQLDAEGCEGVVLKSLDGRVRLKYVCPGTNARDLRSSAGLLGSVPRSFIINRIVQAAFALHEWEGGGGPERRQALGAALLDAMLASIRAVEHGGDLRGFVEERHEIRMHEERHADRLLAQISRSATVQVREESRQREPDGMLRIVLVKRYPRATGYFQSRLAGGAVED